MLLLARRRCTFLPCWAALSICISTVLPATADDWPGWRGPNYSGKVPTSLEVAGATTLEVVWMTAIGPGYSSVSIADGKAVTMFSDGQQDHLAAFASSDGHELWRHTIGPTYVGHDGSHDGPISTPLLAAGRVFALAPRGQLVALSLADGQLIWSQNVVEDLGATKPHYGFSTSPVLDGGVLVVQLGREDTAISGFDPATGKELWRVGKDGVNYQSPIVTELGGQRQILAAGNSQLFGLDARTGTILWQQEHGGDQSAMGGSTLNPVLLGQERLFMTSTRPESMLYQFGQGDNQQPATPRLETLWTSRSIRGTYSTPVVHGEHLYGYSSRFLTAVDAASGEAVWKSRQPGDGFVIGVGDHLVLTTKRGSLHVAEASSEGYREVAGLELFKDDSWTPASYAEGAIFARSMGHLARVRLRPASPPGATGGIRAAALGATDAFLAKLETATEPTELIAAFFAQHPEMPLIEGNQVHFLYHGEAQDMAIASDWIGDRLEEAMVQVAGTQLFHYSTRLPTDARLNYHFIRDFEDQLPDPKNPRTTEHYRDGQHSWFAMPAWHLPSHLQEPTGPRGRIETIEIESEGFDGKRSLNIYLPPGYDEDDGRRYPVAYVHWGGAVRRWGQLENSLDNLIGKSVEPLIAVYIQQIAPEQFGEMLGEAYVKLFAEQIVPLIDQRFRTLPSADQRANIGSFFGAFAALNVTLNQPHLVGKLGLQSTFLLTRQEQAVNSLLQSAEQVPLLIYLDWGRFDLRAEREGWSLVKSNRRLLEELSQHGYQPAGGEVQDGHGFESWKSRNDRWLEALFPLQDRP